MKRLICTLLLFMTLGHAAQDEEVEEVETWLGLEVVEEADVCDTDDERYSSRDYTYGSGADVAMRERFDGYYSPYENIWYEKATDVDIEHIVARNEAHQSGLCKVSKLVRYEFANDLLNLTMAHKDINRNQKSDNDPGEWLPPNNECWYVWQVRLVKLKYNLSIDSQERDEMKRVLESCTVDEIFLDPPEQDGSRP